MIEVLAIEVRFPAGVYSGAVMGAAEELPEHLRLHEAFVAASAGGPWATAAGNVLVASELHRSAVEWLEEHEPLGVVIPPIEVTRRNATRFRWRASPVVASDTDFEPMAALGGPIVYLWPAPMPAVVDALRDIAVEVTHVGRADSIVLVNVDVREMPSGPGVHRIAARRGPGRVLRIPRPGRFAALADAHLAASYPGAHRSGSLGAQAPDLLVTGANDAGLELRRFELIEAAPHDWPYDEVWELLVRDAPAAIRQTKHRVAAAVGIHRSLVRAIGDDVPSFVTGRDGDGPQRGAGHLAVHVAQDEHALGTLRALLAIPSDVVDADRQQLAAAVQCPLRVGATVARGKTLWFSIEEPRVRSAVPFWLASTPIMTTAVPMVIEINGGPRRGGWTLDDAVVCSVGFALRGVLERQGMSWGSGWAFRSELVRALREDHGVDARAARIRGRSGSFVHRVGGDRLVVAVQAAVDLGDLAPEVGTGFLALGRARHLGGGLLVPQVHQ